MDNTTTTETQTTFKANRRDIRQQVTDTIIAQLEKGVIPWQKPWTGSDSTLLALPRNLTTGERYKGINILLLWSAAIAKDLPCHEWAGLKQWNKKGEWIRKGENGTWILYYETIKKEVDGEIEEIPMPIWKKVFNRAQLASYKPNTESTNLKPQSTLTRIELVDAFVQHTKAIVEEVPLGGACYIPAQDKIYIPSPERFIETEICTAEEGFYGTLLHELVHWSGNETRLNRLKGKRFGDSNYAAEELTAEFGAAFLMAGFGIRTYEKGDHAGYIGHWLKVLKEDKHCLFTASSEASKAFDYLHSLQPQ